jgi:hypothetical protein
MIVNLFEGLNPQSSPSNDVEVPLSLMINLATELSSQQKDPTDPEYNDFFQMINYVLSKDMLNNYPCLNNPFCLEEYMQMVYRWSCYYQGDQLYQLIAHVFFSEKTIHNQDPKVV